MSQTPLKTKNCAFKNFEDKAHRKKQGAGVVSYVKPLLGSNVAYGKIQKHKKAPRKQKIVPLKFSKTRRTAKSKAQA